MLGWMEICLFSGAAGLLLLQALPRLRSYRPLLGGGGVLLLMSALFRNRCESATYAAR